MQRDAFVMLCCAKVYFFANNDLNFLTAVFSRYICSLTDGATRTRDQTTSPLYI